jgi:hypothetical protein
VYGDEVEVTNLRLKKQYSSYELTGEIKNISPSILDAVVLKIIAYDCPESTITAACVIIGENDDVYIPVTIPPNQVRAILKYVSFYDMTQLKGRFLWTYKIVGTRAKK